MTMIIVFIVLDLFIIEKSIKYDRNPIVWLLLGFVITPVLALIFLFIAGENTK